MFCFVCSVIFPKPPLPPPTFHGALTRRQKHNFSLLELPCLLPEEQENIVTVCPSCSRIWPGASRGLIVSCKWSRRKHRTGSRHPRWPIPPTAFLLCFHSLRGQAGDGKEIDAQGMAETPLEMCVYFRGKLPWAVGLG